MEGRDTSTALVLNSSQQAFELLASHSHAKLHIAYYGVQFNTLRHVTEIEMEAYRNSDGA